MQLPKELKEIDARFLTAALGQSYSGTIVAHVEHLHIRQGSASSLRIGVKFKRNPHDLPDTMYVKGDFIDHAYTSAAAFAGEVLYFKHFAESLDGAVKQPACYFAEADTNGQAIVLLEDLSRRRVQFGDCEKPLTVDEAADGVRQLAAMQARYWNGRGLEDVEGINDVAVVAKLMSFLVQPEHFNDYIGRERASFLSEPLRDRAAIEAALNAMFDADKAMPSALVHGDAHIGNTFRDPGGSVGFVDFQAIGRGPYIWDVTYFLTGALTPEDRRSAERDLLALFLGELRSHGATDVPDINAAFLAHRQHMMHGYFNILTPTEMQPDRFAVAMGERFAVAVEDLDTFASLK